MCQDPLYQQPAQAEPSLQPLLYTEERDLFRFPKTVHTGDIVFIKSLLKTTMLQNSLNTTISGSDKKSKHFSLNPCFLAFVGC